MNWIKATVLTTTIGSDIVSQALIDAGSAGTVIEDKNDIALNQRPEGQWDIIDEAIAKNMSDDVKVSGFYPLDDRTADSIARLREKVSGLRSLAPDVDLGKLDISTSTLDDEDWAESWKKEYKGFRLGKSIVIRPSWVEYTPEPGDKIVSIDPGMAFGTGTHETTGMCVSLIEENVRPGMTCLDIGTGTGILAITCAHMGAERVIAGDIDPVAVRVARENVSINGFDSVIECREGDLLSVADITADVVIANIIADVIINIAKPVTGFIKNGGTFICSGIAKDRENDVIEALKAAEFTSIDVRNMGEWTAIACKKA